MVSNSFLVLLEWKCFRKRLSLKASEVCSKAVFDIFFFCKYSVTRKNCERVELKKNISFKTILTQFLDKTIKVVAMNFGNQKICFGL